MVAQKLYSTGHPLLNFAHYMVCAMQSLEELIDKAVPRDIRLNKQLHLDAALGELFSAIHKFNVLKYRS